MQDLRPREDIQKILLSTTSRFVDEYGSDGLLITHAWPDFTQMAKGLYENPSCRNALTVVFRTPPRDPNGEISDYSYMGDIICAYLCILYGKRFDNHGLIEGAGLYHLPELGLASSLSVPRLPQNSHTPRIDLGIELNLAEFARIARLLTDTGLDGTFLRFLDTAGQYYMQALQTFERSPDIAYLSLITCAEVLSNFYHYPKDDLLDEDAKSILAQIASGMEDGDKIAERIKNRLWQVKRRFVKTLVMLVNDYFFSHSESTQPYGILKKEEFHARVSAAYDLRSRYIHTGISFGKWVSLDMGCNSEVLVGEPVVSDKEYRKVLTNSPSYYGLERIIRYALLRFIHVNGVEIDPNLDDPAPDIQAELDDGD